MNYTYEHCNTPERDPDDFWNRFEVSDIVPTEADLAERDRREQSRKDASARISADLRRFVQLVNESFAATVNAEFSPGASSRKVVGRDGIERERQKLHALIGLGSVDAMKLPSDDEADRIGEILAADVRRGNPDVAAFAYVGPAPIGLLGERFGAPDIRLVATVEGLHAEARLGMYFAPIAMKEAP